MKTCQACGASLPMTRFRTFRASPDGHRDVCRGCWASLPRAERIALMRVGIEHDRQRARELHQARPEIAWASSYRSRCHAYGLVPVVEPFTREDVVARWGGTCVDCGGPFETLDHVAPVSAGGPHVLGNCQPVCRRDNRRRWDEYRASRRQVSTP